MRTPGVAPAASKPAGNRRSSTFPIVGIGASAGGLEAFTELLKHLPPDTGMGFVLVQHLDPQHESALTQLLARATALPVREVSNNLRVKANRVYVIPPNTDLTIVAGVLKLKPRQKARTPHHSIDHFFESLAHDQRERAIGVILSGTATDGTLGLEAIKSEGGITFAQDDSARYDSMPRSAVAGGCVDFVLSPQGVAHELARIAKHPYVVGQPDELLTPEDDRASAPRRVDAGGARAAARPRRGTAGKDGFEIILLLLRNHSGVDFSLYKSATMQRRITRRMVLNRQSSLGEYAAFLTGNPKELDALYSDMLIGVTSFFRNPEAFDILKRKVFPRILQQRGDEPFRIWTLGCSTGQEAYSLAMTFVEAAEKAHRKRNLQVFATDLNEALLAKARQGLYAKSIAHEVSPERLRRFFVEEEGGYRINKALREIIVFARQNLITDPPFSRMDLISCRNLLIYLEPDLQKKALHSFHYALKPQGYLFLGASESIAGYTDLFAPADKKHRIYSKKAATTPAFYLPVEKARGERPSPGHGPSPHLAREQAEATEGFGAEPNAQREADRITVNQFAPPGVLVSADLQILQFRGATGAYLEPSTGKASFDVLKMAREGLMLPLRAALNQAKKENKTARKRNVRVNQNGKTRTVNVEVIPLKHVRERYFLVLFEEAKAGRAIPGEPSRKPTGSRGVPRTAHAAGKQEGHSRVADLRRELAETRDYLQSVQEQHEAANEELQSSNEEVQSANEELQSVNEELETSKEELESTNEELITVNEEMANRNTELNRLNSDLINLQTSTHLVIVLLKRDLTISRFSEQAGKQFGLLATDVGQPIGTVRHDLVLTAAGDAGGPVAPPMPAPEDLEGFIAEVIASEREREREARDKSGHWYSLRVRPYFTSDNKVDGAVLVLVDIDALKRIEQESLRKEQALRHSDARFKALFESAPMGVYVVDSELRITEVNPVARPVFGEIKELIGSDFDKVIHVLWPSAVADDMVTRFRHTLATGEPYHMSEFSAVRNDREVLETYEWHIHRVLLSDGQYGVVCSFNDIAESVRLKRELENRVKDLATADRFKNEFLALLAHELRNPLAPLRNLLEIMKKAGVDGALKEQACVTMDRQLTQITKLIDDLLDVSRISQGKIRLHQQPVELASALYDAVEACRGTIDSAGHELIVDLSPEPMYMNADPTRLNQAVGNLLSNACKYTDRGGRIWLTLEREGEQAVIRVRDNGIGIAADKLHFIFDMFAQVDSSLERSTGGLGLGLPLVKTLVEMHGGTVEVHSAGIGQGSEFVVRLPISASAPRLLPPEAALSEPAAPTTRRILIVDDNRDSAESLALLLKCAGHETHTVFDGLAAVETAAALRPEVILLDIGLPKLNGYEVCRRIREQPWGKDIMLVAVTGWGQEGDRQNSSEAGFDEHLVKPVEPAALMKLLTLTDKYRAAPDTRAA